MTELPAVLTDRTAFLLQLALARAQAEGEEALAGSGVSGREYGVLAVVAHLEPCPQIRVARALGVDRTTAAAVFAELASRGLVRRVPDPDNRRAYLVSLTPEGARVRAIAEVRLVACDDAFAARLSPADRTRLRTLLRRLAQ